MPKNKEFIYKLIVPVLFTLIFLSVVFLNNYPNYYALINTPQGYVFSGQASWFDPWDINVYVSAIKSGQNSQLLLSNIYTTTPNNAIFYYPLYTFTGYLFSGINPFLLFYVLSVLSTFILLICLFFLINVFAKDFKISIFVLFLISFGGGLGWLFFPNIQSADLFITGFTFTSQFQRAHEGMGVLLYLLSLILYFHAVNKNRFLFNAISLFSILLSIFFYPYYVLSYFLICSFYTFFKSRKEKKNNYFVWLILNFAFCFPVLLMYFFHLRSNLTFGGVLSQQLSSPNLINLLFGYGLLVPLFLISIKEFKKTDENFFLVTWVLISLILSFFPFGFARFYLRGLFLPVILFVILNSKQYVKILDLPKILIFLVLAAVIPISSFFVFYKRIDEVTKNNHWYYLTTAEIDATKYLKTKKGGIFSYYTLGNYIPAVTNNAVYFGHFIQTPNSQTKVMNIAKFYSNTYSEEEARELLKNENISYVFYGSEEKEITKNYSKQNVLNYSFLDTVFKNDQVTIYSVKH